MSETIHLSYTTQTGNFWIDNGLAYLLERWGEGTHRVDDIMNHLLSELVQPTGNKGEYYDAQLQQVREYEKRNWVEPVNLFIKVPGDAGHKIVIGGATYYSQPPEFRLEIDLDSKKQGLCDVCGEVSRLADAKMWMFPYVVNPKDFGNFYSATKRGLRLCARCALAGLAGYLSWWWCRHGKDIVHFFLFHADIAELRRLHGEVLRALQLSSERGGNVRPAFSGEYLHETTLGVLLFLFSHIPSSDVLSDKARQLLADLLGGTAAGRSEVVLYAVTGVRAQAFDMKLLREFSNLQQVYHLYEQWKTLLEERYQVSNAHQQLVDILRQFEERQNNERNTLWRERIARAVLELDDPLPTLEGFLFDVLAKEGNPLRRGTEDVLVNYYLKEVFGMDEQFIRTLAGFGHGLGAAAREKEAMGLLYALRNAKNIDEFYRVLNDIQFRLDLTVPESLLKLERGERIAGAPWRRVKHMLAVYAMNAYLRRQVQEEYSQDAEEG